MNEQGASSVVWREALAIIRRYPTATLLPAVMLGGLAQAPAYFIEGRPVLDRVVTYLTAAFTYYLYLTYAEEIATEAERKARTASPCPISCANCAKLCPSHRACS